MDHHAKYMNCSTFVAFLYLICNSLSADHGAKFLPSSVRDCHASYLPSPTLPLHHYAGLQFLEFELKLQIQV